MVCLVWASPDEMSRRSKVLVPVFFRPSFIPPPGDLHILTLCLFVRSLSKNLWPIGDKKNLAKEEFRKSNKKRTRLKLEKKNGWERKMVWVTMKPKPYSFFCPKLFLFKKPFVDPGSTAMVYFIAVWVLWLQTICDRQVLCFPTTLYPRRDGNIWEELGLN